MKEQNIKTIIEYDGTDFKGWQIQKKGERTVQDEVKKAVKKIFGQEVDIIGSGRTDSGVHALGQTANFKVRTKMHQDEILSALNGNLPKDIVVHEAKEVHKNFHSQYSAKSKIYRYSILNRATRTAQQRDFFLHYPKKLSIKRIKDESACLKGKHDFRSFQASDPGRKNKDNTIRTIKDLSIVKKGDFIYIEVEANGFLYKMVRNIVGTLLEVGCGKLEKDSIKQILRCKDRSKAGPTAPAKGLCLILVKY